MSATVSVVMPSFNSERYIGEAIGSVLCQSHPSYELIVVDGGSKDRTRSIVQQLALKDSRIKLVENVDDRGPAHARYAGIKMSRGEFIAFLDADDYWIHTKLEEQVRFMQTHNASFSYTHYRRVSDDGTRVGCVIPMQDQYDFNSALRHRGIGTLTVMLRRELLTEDVISRWMRAGGEEYLWWLLILRKGGLARLLPQDLARYRDTASSLSKNQIYTLKSVWRMYREDIGLRLVEATSHYASYFVDSAIRKLRLKACAAATTAGASLRGRR